MDGAATDDTVFNEYGRLFESFQGPPRGRVVIRLGVPMGPILTSPRTCLSMRLISVRK